MDRRDRSPFARLLADLRRSRGLSTGRLADLAGVPKKTLENWAQGVSRPRNVEDVLRVAAHLCPEVADAIDLLVAAGFDGQAVFQGHQSPQLARLLQPWRSADTLREALTLLAGLPLDRVPPYAALPAVSHLPIHPDRSFVGRREALLRLAVLLRGETLAGLCQPVVVPGIAGVGKTSLAAAFAHSYGQFFAGGVFWIECEQPGHIESQVAACGENGVTGLAAFSELSHLRQARLVRQAWQQPIPRLLIFNNCEDESLLLDRLLPVTGGCRVLITSRRAIWERLQPALLPLGLLERDESVTLLRQFRPDLNLGEADAVAEALGDLPLALHLAGKYLATYRHEVVVGDYLQHLEAAPLAHQSLSHRDQVSVARALAVSHSALDPGSPTDSLARALLYRLAHLASGEAVPRELWCATIEPFVEGPESLLRADALARLINLGLVSSDQADTLWLHRLVAAYAQEVCGREGRTDALADTEAALLKLLITWVPQREPPRLRLLVPHSDMVIGSLAGRYDEGAGKLHNLQGRLLNLFGAYEAALAQYQQAWVIFDRVLDEDDFDRTHPLHNIANVLHDLGHYEEALRYGRQALALRERLKGPHDESVAMTANILAAISADAKDLHMAKQYAERALGIYELRFGVSGRRTAYPLCNLAYILIRRGQWAEAAGFAERARSILRPLEHTRTDMAIALDALAAALSGLGEGERAREHAEEAVAIYAAAYGIDHHQTAMLRFNLACILERLGEWGLAHQTMVEAQAILERDLGAEHPSTAEVRARLEALAATAGHASA